METNGCSVAFALSPYNSIDLVLEGDEQPSPKLLQSKSNVTAGSWHMASSFDFDELERLESQVNQHAQPKDEEEESSKDPMVSTHKTGYIVVYPRLGVVGCQQAECHAG